jgi:ligand-binding sensor domain-containing protein
MRYIFLPFYLLIFFDSIAQPGNYFLSHFSPTKESSDNVCFDIVQNQNGIMYFATRNGILEFDGRTWSLIPANGAAYSLQVSSDGNLYWAGASGYGRIVTDDQGSQQVQTLSALGVTEVFASLMVNEKMYFLNSQGLYIYSDEKKEPVTIPSTNLTGSFTNVFELYDSIYLVSEQEGLHKLEGNTLVKTSLGFGENEEILFATRGENGYLIGLVDSRIFFFGPDQTPIEIQLKDAQYAKANVVVEGKWLNPQLLVLATLRGGMMFVNAISGKTEQIVNYSTGLPDNEVYTLMTDKGQSVWAAHEYGFTRISPSLPFRSFSNYEGLQGNLLCVISFRGQVYVGTSSGLFKLVQEDIYDEIVSYVDVELKDQKKKRKEKDKTGTAQQNSSSEPINESKKRGFLRFLKRRKTTLPKRLLSRTIVHLSLINDLNHNEKSREFYEVQITVIRK